MEVDRISQSKKKKKKKRQNILKNSSELCLSWHDAPVTLDNGQTSLSTDVTGTTSRVSVKTADRVTGTRSPEREFFKWNCSALSKSHTPLSVEKKAEISQGKTWKPSYVKLWMKIRFKFCNLGERNFNPDIDFRGTTVSCWSVIVSTDCILDSQ